MATVGFNFNYKKEQRRSLIFFVVTSLTALFPALLMTYVRFRYTSLYSLLDIIAVYFSHIIHYGASFQFFMSFSLLLRKIWFCFAVLNRFLR